MSIISSTIIEDSVQKDGRRWICERHVDHISEIFEIRYMAGAGTNINDIMTSRIVLLESESKRQELENNLANALSNDSPAPTTKYSTNAEFAALLREKFKISKGRDALRLGWYVESFNLTNNQLANLFGITVGQAATFQTKLDNMAASYEAMQLEVGE